MKPFVIIFRLFVSTFLVDYSLTFRSNYAKTYKSEFYLSSLNVQNQTIYVPFNKLIENSKRTGDWSKTIKAAEEVLDKGPITASIMTGIIRSFGESGELGKAISMLGMIQI